MEHSIATLGSHSALDVSEGAKQEGFKTIVACQRGREKSYLYYKTRKRGKGEVGVADEILLMDKFSDIVDKKYVDILKEHNAIFVPNRSFSVYVGYENIEKHFSIPVFGNRFLLRAEERDEKNNQYDIMKKAGIRTPKKFKSPKDIDRPCIVKVSEAKRNYERAFFTAHSYTDYAHESQKRLKQGIITEDALKKAVIEEYIVGAQFNFNFFYSPVHEELELLGIDTRRQTNLDGYLRMPGDLQGKFLRWKQPSTIEVGHIACTLRESLLEQAFDAGERIVNAASYYYKNGLIGPFALQGAITAEEGKEEFICFDISFRIPGSPGTRFTPYSSYLFRESISFGRRIAMEIKEAEKRKEIDKITT